MPPLARPICQTRSRGDRRANRSYAGDDRSGSSRLCPFFPVRLVVFPEFGHAAHYPTVEELLDRLAVPIPNEHTDRYGQKARQHGIYIQTASFLERDNLFPGHVFNSTCLIGPEGLLTRYRKVHTWIPWEVHASPHDVPGYTESFFPVAETEIGRLGAAICYDWLFPEAIRQLAVSPGLKS